MTPTFPPLMSGHATTDAPIDTAIKMARTGCDGGTVVYNLDGSTLRAAIIFAPDVVLQQAVAIYPICCIGFQNALGALAPPEIAVQLGWSGPIHVNGAQCGALRMHAANTTADQIPDWLIVDLHVPLWPASDNPGETPNETALYAEGCADVPANALLESWARHTLSWINRWSTDGTKPVHNEWVGLLVDADQDGFVGVDEDFGLLTKSDDQTLLTPLISLLEKTA